MGVASLTTCHLSSVTEFVAKAIPESWVVGVFGSTAACGGPPTGCMARSKNQDLDLLIVFSEGYEMDALRVRRNLMASLAAISIPADVVLLSETEAASPGFWHKRASVGLERA